jgi:hypothetical protein
LVMSFLLYPKNVPFTIKNQLCLVMHQTFCKCFQNDNDKSKVTLFSFSQ